MSSLEKYIASARSQGQHDNQIKQDLIDAGWDALTVEAGLGKEPLKIPPPPPPGGHGTDREADQEQIEGTDNAVKVVAIKTTAGIEYSILFLSLWVAAMSLAAVLHSAVDMQFSQTSLYTVTVTISTAALVVSLPIFVWLFLWLKKQEIAHPEIRNDQNRKGAIQLTLIVTFLIGIGKLILYVYGILSSASEGGSIAADSFHTLITLLIAGSIFAYYWDDEHRRNAS